MTMPIGNTLGIITKMMLQNFFVSGAPSRSVQTTALVTLSGGVEKLTLTAATALTLSLPAGAEEGWVYSKEVFVTGAYALSFTSTNFDITYTSNGSSPTFTPASGEIVIVNIRGWVENQVTYRQILLSGSLASVTL